MNPIQIISQEVFDKIRSRFSNLEMGNQEGAVTIDPAEARFFDFDFVKEGVDLGRVSISLSDLGSLKIYYSKGITENQDTIAKKFWYDFLKEMRFFARRRLLRFDTRDIAKTNLDKNDFQHLAKTQGPKDMDMMTMNESRWNSRNSKKTSRAVKGCTEVIVRHRSPVDEMYPGARSLKKNIKAIFIQNRDGERYKYPFIHPAGAFAMAQHVDHGGVPHDPAGKAIIRMSEEIAQLQEFQKKIHNAQLHDDAMGITDRAVGRLNELKARINSLGKRRHYEAWMSEFTENDSLDNELMELDPVTMEDYKTKFTQTEFNEELASFFPLIHRIMQETNKVNLEDYVEEGSVCEVCNESPCTCEDETNEDFESPEEAFEEWAEATEKNKLAPDQIEALKQALSSQPPQSLEIAYNFFNEFGIEDDELNKAFETAAEQDTRLGTTTNPLDIFAAWAQKDYPELARELGIGEQEQAPAQDQEPAAPPAADQGQAPEAPADQSTAENDDGAGTGEIVAESDPRHIIKDIAECVKQFYNRANETVAPFRSEEQVALEAKKKIEKKYGEAYGEQAEALARKFVRKLTQEWEQKHGTSAKVGAVQDDGLGRLRELVGHIKGKIEEISGETTNIMPANAASSDSPIPEETDDVDTDSAIEYVQNLLFNHTDFDAAIEIAARLHKINPKKLRHDYDAWEREYMNDHPHIVDVEEGISFKQLEELFGISDLTPPEGASVENLKYPELVKVIGPENTEKLIKMVTAKMPKDPVAATLYNAVLQGLKDGLERLGSSKPETAEMESILKLAGLK